MYVLSATPKYFCEACRTRIPIVDLEAVFIEKLTAKFSNLEKVNGYIRKASLAVDEKQRLLELTKTEIARIKEQAARTHQLYLDNAIDSAGFKELYTPQQERLRQLQDEAMRLQSELDICKVDSLSADAVVTESFDLHQRWLNAGLEEKRRVVDNYVDSIVVDEPAQEIEINLSGFVTSEKTTNSQQLL